MLGWGSSLLAGCGADTADRPNAANRPVAHGVQHGTIYGDYDTDDYDRGHDSDADNDDSLRPKDRDGDSDNATDSDFDLDDSSVVQLGRAASAPEARAIGILITRYYAAAAAENGTMACSMIIAPEAKAVPEDLGRPPGSPYLRGKTCGAVLTKAFKLSHQQLSTYARELRVAAVRLQGGSGLAVLVFKDVPTRQMPVERERGRWKVASLLDLELP